MSASLILRNFLASLIAWGCLCASLCGCQSPALPRPTSEVDYHGDKITYAEKRAPKPATPDSSQPPPPPAPGKTSTRYALSEAVGQALRQNQKILVSSYNPPKAEQDLKGANAVYDPSVFSTANLGHNRRPIQSLLDTGSLYQDVLTENKWSTRTGAKKLTPTGATLAVYQELNRLGSDSSLVVPNPQTASTIVVEASQPLLQGFWDKTNRAAIAIARLNVEMSNEDFRQTVMDVVTEVSKGYWQLTMEHENAVIAGRALEMAEELLRREKTRLDRGISSSLDTDRALTAVEMRRADHLRAQTRVKMISDQLKLLLGTPEASPEIIPTSKPHLKPSPVDLSKSLEMAVQNRPELELAQKNLKVSETRKDLAQHNRLPKLNAVLRLTRNGIGVVPGSSLDMLYTDNYNSFLGGLEFEYPLGHRGAQAEYKKRTLEYDQSFQELKRVGDQVVNEVGLVIRELNLAQKEIPVTLQAKEAAERVKDSENVRFELGQKTNEELLRAQDLWAAASREYVRAVINYNISLVTLGRAQGTLLKELGVNLQK